MIDLGDCLGERGKGVGGGVGTNALQDTAEKAGDTTQVEAELGADPRVLAGSGGPLGAVSGG